MKKLSLILLAMTIAVSLCAASATATDLRHAISGLRVLSGINENNPDADTDGNGKVELQDVILSLQIVAGLRSDVPTIVLLIPTDIDKIRIAWLPVSSSSTSAANMSYEVHLSKDADFTPSASTRKTTVKDQAQADVSGLETGTTYLQAEAYVSASLDIFIKKIILLDKTKVYTSPQWYLFSLPKLSLASSQSTVSANEAVTLTATVTDGANNPFNDSTIKWQVYPSDKGTLTPKGRTATFVPSAEGTYTIFFSGYGALGEVGRQFASLSISVSDPSSLSCTYYCGMTDYYTGSCIGYSETCYINGFVHLYRRTYYPSGNIMEELLYEKGVSKQVRFWGEDGKFSGLWIPYEPSWKQWGWGDVCGSVARSYKYRQYYTDEVNIYCIGNLDGGCFAQDCKIVCNTPCYIPDPPTVNKAPLPPANKSLWTDWK